MFRNLTEVREITKKWRQDYNNARPHTALGNKTPIPLSGYLDKLSDSQHRIVQDISVEHTRKVLGGHIGVLFYDVTTLYFEADYEDELRKSGFSKEGQHKNPQIILGLLVSLGGYPLAYCIHEGNKYEGHTMLPVVTEFVRKYALEDFTVLYPVIYNYFSALCCQTPDYVLYEAGEPLRPLFTQKIPTSVDSTSKCKIFELNSPIFFAVGT